MSYRTHIKTWLDSTHRAHSDLPICGRANTYTSVILAPGEMHVWVDCKRCLKLWAEQKEKGQ